jgi:hypothetical protein
MLRFQYQKGREGRRAITGNTKQKLSLSALAFVFIINAEHWFHQIYFILFYNCNICWGMNIKDDDIPPATS